jgi:hypothetical protein
MYKLFVRWTVLSLFALVIATGVAAGADSPPSETPQVTLPPDLNEGEVPSASDVTEGLAKELRQARAREAELNTPAMAERRRGSRFTYTQLDSPAEAAELLRSIFGSELATLNQDPARFLSDARLEQRLGSTGARVSKDGETALLESGSPVVAEDEDGQLRKVDLSLEPAGDDLVAANPLVEVEIPADADSGLSIATSEGPVVIEPVTGQDAKAVKFGDKNVLYANIGVDRDLLVALVANGVETFDQLRSADSAEELRYDLQLPDGAELVPDGVGGANVVKEEQTILHVSFPTAVDAQGSNVPVKLEIDGSSIVLRVEHRGRDVAYPILVDPFYELMESWYWYGNGGLAALSDGTWQWGSNVGWIHGSTSCIYACWGSGRGLFVSTPSGAFYGSQYGQWTYTPPGGTSYVTGASLNPFWRDNHNCNKAQYPQPHDYAGIWSPTNPNGWDTFQADRANDYGNAQLSAIGRVLVIGLGTGPGGSNPCWRDIMLGGASVWISDPDNPTWNGTPSVSSAWTHNTMLPVNVSASDSGLGVKYFNLFTTDASGNPVTMIGNAVHPCSGLKASPCPGSWSTQITNYNPASLPSGIRSLALRAYDPLHEIHYSGQAVFLKVDHTTPVIKTSGELLSANPIKYHLDVDAEDGSSASLGTAQSGMKKLEFYLDGAYQGAWPNENPGNCVNPQQGLDVGSCKFEGVDVDLPRALFGPHTLKIVAIDSYGHTTTKTHNLELPKDVTAPELTASGALKTAAGSWVAAKANTLTVEAKDVETGATEATVFVDGEEVVTPAAQECKLGGCPLKQPFSVDLLGYEQGSHTIKAVVRDGAGNSTQSSWTVSVDPSTPDLKFTTTPEIPSGWTPQLTSLGINFNALDTNAAGNGSGIAKVEAIVPIEGGGSWPQTLYSSSCKATSESPCPQEAAASKSLSLFSLIAQGTVQVPVKAYDFAGNVSTQAATLKIDRTAPQVKASGPLMESAVGTLVPGGTKLNLTVTDKGSGTGVVELLLDGTVEKTITLAEIEADGGNQTCSGETCTLTYSFAPDIGQGLSSGNHTLVIRAKDLANRAGSISKEVTLDTRAPKLDLTTTPEIPSGWTPQLTSLGINFKALDSTATTTGSGITKIEAIMPIFAGSNYTQTLYSNTCKGTVESPCPQEVAGTKNLELFGFLTQGTVQVPIRSYDLAGNVSTQTLTLRIDRAAPQVKAAGPLTETAVGTIVPGGTKLDLTVTDAGSGVGSVELLLDGTVEKTITLGEIEADGGKQTCSAGSCTLTYSFAPNIGQSLAAGNHTLVIRAKDLANRAGSISKEVTLDTRAPKLDLTTTPEIPSGWTPQLTSLGINFKALDTTTGGNGSGITKIEAIMPIEGGGSWPQALYSNACKGTAESPCQQEAAGTKNLSLFSLIAQGNVQVPIKAYDLAGNVSTHILNLKIDRAAPQVKATGPLAETPVGTLVPNGAKLNLTVTDKGSGTGVVELLLNGNIEDTLTLAEIEAGGGSQTCSGETCTLNYSFVPDIGQNPSGNYTFMVRAKDLAERTGTLSKEVTLDTRAPKLDLTTTPEIPSGWTPQLTSLGINFKALDSTATTTGSGITKIEALVPVFGTTFAQTLYSNTCKGTTESPCPQEAAETKNLSLFSFITPGIAQVPIKAYDLAGNVSTQTLTLRIDRAAPQVKAAGALVETPLGSVIGSNSKLDLTITDAGSGVGSVELLLDGNVEETITLEEIEADGGKQTCNSAGTCTLTYSFIPDVGHSAPAGNHTLLIRAKDLAERTGTLSKEVTLDTQAPEASLSGLLAESAGFELEAAEADLKVVATDPGSGFTSGIKWIVIAVDGQQVAALDNCKALPCAPTGELSYTYKEVDWGTGPHEVQALITDWVGNTIERQVMVNAPITSIAPECPTGPQETVEAAGVVTPTEASQLLAAAVPPAVAPTEPSGSEPAAESPFDPSVTEEGQVSINEQGIDVTGTPTGGGIEDAPAGAFTVGQALCMQPLHKTDATDAPVEVGGDAVLYANSAPETDTVVRPTAYGTTIVEHLRGPASPSSFSWEIKLGPGEELRKLANGSVVVVKTGVNVDEVEVPSGVPPLEPGSIPDVEAQQIRTGANLAEANNAVEGEVTAVIAAPQAVLDNGSTAPALLQISGGQIVTATLPANVVAETIAMIIEANTAPDPAAMCAHSFESSPNLYENGCNEPEDPEAEPEASPEENVSMHDLQLAGQPQRNEFFVALNSSPVASASAESGGNGYDKRWCRSGYPREIYCGFFYDDKVFATRVEVGMFNVPSDSTKANAFKHAVWVSAMVNSDPPDSEALSFALNHEKGQQKSPHRGVRYKSSMDVLNNWTAYKYSHYREEKDDMQACQHWVNKVGPALFIPFNQNPNAWANRVSFQHYNLVYRRKYESGTKVHLVIQDCNAGLARGIYFGA